MLSLALKLERVNEEKTSAYQAGGLQVNLGPCTRTPVAVDLRLRNSLPS